MNRPLHQMFAAVPDRYDLVNRVVTVGLDQRWRREAAKICLQNSPGRILDLCSGTGDMPLILARLAPAGTEIVSGDFVPGMLEVARAKATAAGVADRIRFDEVDASALPYEDGRFDAITITFGFRNLTYKNPKVDLHLAEIRRALAPGGRLVFVESSQPRAALIRTGFHAWLRGFVAPVGGRLSGEPGAYRYLATSMRHYPDAEAVRRLLEGAGYVEVGFRRLLGGVAAIHWASRPSRPAAGVTTTSESETA